MLVVIHPFSVYLFGGLRKNFAIMARPKAAIGIEEECSRNAHRRRQIPADSVPSFSHPFFSSSSSTLSSCNRLPSSSSSSSTTPIITPTTPTNRQYFKHGERKFRPWLSAACLCLLLTVIAMMMMPTPIHGQNINDQAVKVDSQGNRLSKGKVYLESLD